MQKKVAPRKELAEHQKYLFHAIGLALKHVGAKQSALTHADFLRVLEEYRHIFTEDWINKYPDTVAHMSKIIGKE